MVVAADKEPLVLCAGRGVGMSAYLAMVCLLCGLCLLRIVFQSYIRDARCQRTFGGAARDVTCGIPPATVDRRIADAAFHSARATSACDEELGGLGAGGGGVASVRQYVAKPVHLMIVCTSIATSSLDNRAWLEMLAAVFVFCFVRGRLVCTAQALPCCSL